MKAHQIIYAFLAFVFLIVLLYAANEPFVIYDSYNNGSNGLPYHDIQGLTMKGKVFTENYYVIFATFFFGLVAAVSKNIIAGIIGFVGVVLSIIYFGYVSKNIVPDLSFVDGAHNLKMTGSITYFAIILILFAFVLFVNLIINIIRVALKPTTPNTEKNDLLDF